MAMKKECGDCDCFVCLENSDKHNNVSCYGCDQCEGAKINCEEVLISTEDLDEEEGKLLAEKVSPIFEDILEERIRQNDKWGEQNHEMGAKISKMKQLAGEMKHYNFHQPLCWYTVLMEEVYEAFAETGPERQREEMVQVAAVAVQIIEYLDRKMEEK